MRAARAAMSPALLGASDAAATDPNAPLQHHRDMRCGHGWMVPERQAVPGRERIRGDEQRRAGVGARSAHQNVWLAASVRAQRAQRTKRVLRRDPGPSSAVKSARSDDRHG